MTAADHPIPDEGAIIAWLWRQRAARDPSRLILIRGVDGQVVVQLPRNGREVDQEPGTDERG